MEEALRCMLQYKTRCSQLKQDKAALSAAYEARVQQCQTTIGKLSQENEALKKQVKTLEAQQGGGAVQQALLERLRAVESDNRLLSSDAEHQRRQYERCLDDVANQVVRALLSQKGLREEIGALQQRIRELETQNRALTTLLVQQLQIGDQDLKQQLGDVTSPELGDDMVTLSKPRLRRPAGRHRPSPSCGQPAGLSCGHGDDPAAAILAAVANIDPALWLQVARPQSLHLAPSLEGAQESAAGAAGAADDSTDLSWQQDAPPASSGAAGVAKTGVPEAGVDEAVVAAAVAVAVDDDQDGSSSPESSPESGNRDEGYSTMSSDVQAEHSTSSLRASEHTALPPAGLGPGTELEDVKEEAELVCGAETAADAVSAEAGGGRVLLLDLKALSARHSFPPARDLQAVLRNSFSDSHLCLSRLLHHAASFASTPASCPAAAAPPVLLVELADRQHPLRRARATPSLLPSAAPLPLQMVCEAVAEEDGELGADWWDSDYVQHWLRLDETRSALQQRHREALDLELEYDQAEMEDWSLSLSCDDLDLSWRRGAPASSTPAPAPAAEAATGTALPSIQENNSVELEEDASECLWNDASYLETGVAGAGGSSRGCAARAAGASLGAGWPYALPDAPDAMISSLAVNAAGSSPGGSWTSSAAASDCYDCCLNGCHGEDADLGSSKRSSAALSGCSDESAASAATSAASRESPTVGTDFTRDFYRLVKFESTKSLASNSSSRHSRQHGDNLNNNNSLPAPMDREQALQSVLKFIAEQQKYCHSREEQDSAELSSGCSRPVSYTFSVEEEQAESHESQGEPHEPRSLSGYSDDLEGSGEEPRGGDAVLEAQQSQERLSVLADAQERIAIMETTAVLADDVIMATLPAAPVLLATVLEDEELDTTSCGRVSVGDPASASSSSASVPSVLVCDANDKAVSFHENATSKDVIDELNRLIRKGEGEEAALPSALPASGTVQRPRPQQGVAVAAPSSVEAASSVDAGAFCCPTGWVHVERDIDFTDPKARANLLDVMLASSASSGSMSSSGSESGDGEDLPKDYRHLHRLHRFRRHKKASAFREPFGVLRFPSSNLRPSIIGRDDFFVRYGDKEREAISSFDFLDDMSTASLSCASGASSTLGSMQKLDAVLDEQGERGEGRTTPTADTAEDSDERTGEQLSISDSCGNSLSGSRSSLEERPGPEPAM
ncbi:uncharacterized protein LOC117652085 isoform X2 [Thrips palmi]|nr:uncharacterized protein LOC117652085 isoform X2 [Thrips palmi]